MLFEGQAKGELTLVLDSIEPVIPTSPPQAPKIRKPKVDGKSA
jgi:hypothetical protein